MIFDSDAEHRKCALVVGASRGIGRVVAERLAGDGFDVVVTCRAASAESRRLVESIAAAGRSSALLELDVRDRAACRAVLLGAFGENGAPDVVVYNAGIARDNLFAFMSDSEWDEVIDTNLEGFYNCVKPLVFGMLARKSGRIIVISSASGQSGQAGQVNYSASKAALIGAVKALAREVGRKGVLVNAVAPGVITTDMTRELPLERVLPLIPMNRPGEVAEVAAVVSFLAGPDSSYVTGQVIAVNGGLVMS